MPAPTPTPIGPVGPVGGDPTGPTINVSQGPRWLIDLYLTPPPWVNPLLQTIGVLSVVFVLYRLHQSEWSVDPDVQLQMIRIASTVVAVITGVLVMANFAHQPYLVDVVVGFALSWVSVTLALSPTVRSRYRTVLGLDDTSRLVISWATLIVISLLGPEIVSVHGRGMSLLSTRLVIATVSAGMLILNLTSFDGQNAPN